jgi:hypothetical protein
VKSEDFGTFEEFGVTNLLAQSISNGSYVFRPSAGDWSWIRPGVIRSNQGGTTIDDVGAIDIFSIISCAILSPLFTSKSLSEKLNRITPTLPL